MLFKKERMKVIKTALKAYNDKLIPLTLGNFSLRDNKTGYICITPSGMEYQKLKPEDIVIMDIEGIIVEGKRKPSIENPLHRAVYKKRPDINGIVHVHSTFASAWACCCKPIPETVAEMVSVLGGAVECAPYRPMSTIELAEITSEYLEDRNAILMANHGVLAVGVNIDRAFINAVIVEEGAKIAFYAQQIGDMTLIPETECRFLTRTFLDKYGQK